MDTTQGLQLLAENSWGVTRQILYQAKNEIESLRATVIEARETVELAWDASRPDFTNEDQAKLDEGWGKLNATAERLMEIQEAQSGSE